ncbi:MAG TPA: beta-galactosidase, partial [bacterium]|nr:beta-galactosidase [bacterium]
MKKGNFAGLLVRAILFCFFLGASRGRAQNNPLAILDFEKSLQINLTVVGQVPEIVSLAGGRAACLSAQRLSVPVHWSADMPNPGFPGLAEKMGKPIVARPRLVLDLDQKVLGLNGPVDLALVITVYDLCRVNRDRQKILVELVRNDEKRSTLQVSFATSGDPFASDTLLQPRWLRKTLVAPGVLLVDRQEGGDIVISPEDRVLIRRIEVYRLPGSPLEERISRRLPEMVSYPGYLPPVSCLDLWRRDFSDLMVAQAKSYAGRAEAEEWLRLFQRHLFWTRKKPLPEDFQARGRYLDTLVESSLLEMDEFFYEGKIALIREDTVSYRRLLDTVTNTLHQVEVASSQLRTKIEAEYRRNFPSVSFQPAAVSHKERRLEEVDSPENRVTFLCFANSPWDYWDPYNATGRFLHYYGINTKGYLAGGLSLNESGQVNPSSLRHLLQTIDRERACGFDVAIGVGHHGYHLTEHGNLPAWLAQKSGKDSLYDLDFYGRPQKYMDIWNPLVRQYFQNSLQALTREVLSAPHVFRYFYFGEPQCASGYTRWGRQAFREYLKKKYGSLSSLNALWKTNYESFEAIEPPPPPGEKLRIQPSGLTYEFETFRRESFNEWWQMAREALRQGNSEAKLWFEGWGRFDYLLRHGMDQLGTFQRADMAAVHSGAASEVQRVWGYSLSRVTGTLLCDGETITSGDYYQGGCASLQQLAAA